MMSSGSEELIERRRKGLYLCFLFSFPTFNLRHLVSSAATWSFSLLFLTVCISGSASPCSLFCSSLPATTANALLTHRSCLYFSIGNRASLFLLVLKAQSCLHTSAWEQATLQAQCRISLSSPNPEMQNPIFSFLMESLPPKTSQKNHFTAFALCSKSFFLTS